MHEAIDFPPDERVARDFGPCCACGKHDAAVRNFMMLDKKAPVKGAGWGCLQCGIPNDGAVAVICDDCLIHHDERSIGFVCYGDPIHQLRKPVEELTGLHEHDLRYHPECEAAMN